MLEAIVPGWIRVRLIRRTETTLSPAVADGSVAEGVESVDSAAFDQPSGEPARPFQSVVARSERRYVAILITVAIFLFLIAVRLRTLYGFPAGDEPGYLVISQTLEKYQSVDVMLDYNNHDYRSFSPGDLEPHVVTAANGRIEPMHNLGGPLLWLIPFMLFGRLGAVGFMAAVSVLIVWNIYYFLRERGIDPFYSFVVSLLMAIASPVYTYAAMSFVEPIGALMILYAVRVLLGPTLGPIRLMVAGIGLALLPWIHSRFLMFTGLISLFFVFRIFRETGWSAWRRYLPLVIPVALSLILNEVYNVVYWGEVNPASNMSNVSGNRPFQVPFPVGFLGSMFDRQAGLISNFPIFFLVLTGLLLSLNRARLWTHTVLLTLTVPYVVLICTYSYWWGGYCPAARYIAAILPLFSYYLAFALQRINSTLVLCGMTVLGLGTYAMALASDIFPNDRFSAPGNHNYALDRLSRLFHVNVARHIPSGWEAGNHPLFLTWFGATLLVALVLWAWGLRKPQLPGQDWAPAPRSTRNRLWPHRGLS